MNPRAPWLQLVLLLCFSAGAAHADYKLPMRPPASAVNKTARVETGGAVEILLEARATGGRDVKFILREGPTRGRLGPIQRVRPGQATVTYFHSGKRGAGMDRFTYAVQASGTPVSAAAHVVIEAVNPGPELVAPPLVDFGEVAVGETAEQEIELRNTGGGVLSGRFVVEPPFAVAGDGSYRIAAGKRSKLVIRFQPQSEGEQTGFGNLNGIGGGRIELTGRSVSPMSVLPSDQLVLRSGPNGIRAGRFRMRSNTERELVCKLEYADSLRGPDEVRVAPFDYRDVDVWMASDAPGAYDGSVTFRSEALVVAIPVQAPVAGPRFQLISSTPIDAGRPKAGESAGGAFEVQNTGGTAGEIEIAGTVEISSAKITLKPSERRAIEFYWRREEPGRDERNIEVRAGGETIANLAAVAEFMPRSEPVAAEPPPVAEQAPEPVVVVAIPEKEEEQTGPKLDRPELIERAHRKLVFQWAVPPGATGFITEMRGIVRTPEGPKIEWIRFEADSLKIANGVATMELRGLASGAAYTVRVRATTRAGDVGPPSPASTATTPIGQRLENPLAWALAAILLAMWGFVIYRRFRYRA